MLADAHPQESQESVSQHPRFLKILPSRPPFLPQQPVSHPQGAATSQPQLGAAQRVLQAGAQAVSQPQLGAAQVGAQADPQGSQPVSHPRLQPSRLHFDRCNARTSSSNGLRRGLQQDVSHPQLGAQALSIPQLGAHPLPQAGAHAFSIPQLGAQPVLQAGAHAFSIPQLGAAQPLLHAGAQPFPQADSHPQLGAAQAGVVSQQVLSHPQPFNPSMRSSNPPAKVWVQRLAPSTIDPTSMFHFIEPQLPIR